MKFYTLLLIVFLTVAQAFAAESWLTFSKPFPVRSCIPYGGGILLATDGGIRYRAIDGDRVFHSEDGLEEAIFHAIVGYEERIYAISKFGLIAALDAQRNVWGVLNRSYVANKSRVLPDGAALADSIIVIAFEDRLAFFDLITKTSIATIDRIGEYNLSADNIQKLVVHGDSLYVNVGEQSYVREMDWYDVGGDAKLFDPLSWSKVKDPSLVNGLVEKDSNLINIEGDIIDDPSYTISATPIDTIEVAGNQEIIYDTTVVRKTRWIEKAQDKYFLVGDEAVFLYDPSLNSLTDLSLFNDFPLGEPYEVHAVPTGGVVVGTTEGGISYGGVAPWSDLSYPLPGIGSQSAAFDARIKSISVLPDGHTFFHIWGFGFFMFINWGLDQLFSVGLNSGACLDNYFEGRYDDLGNPLQYVISVGSTPAPDSSGFLTTTSNGKKYSINYFKTNGEVYCASQVGQTSMAGPLYATIDEDGSWLLYVGSRQGTAIAADGGLDIIRIPSPKNNGGELSGATIETSIPLESTPVDMVYDSIGDRLWVITKSSLYYLDKNEKDKDTLVSPKSTNGLRASEYSAIDVDIHGNLWLGTTDQGAYRLSLKNKSPDTLTVKSYNVKSGMLSNDVTDLSIDHTLGVVWFTHASGVSRYYNKNLKYSSKNMTDSAKADVYAYPVPFRPAVHNRFVIANIAEGASVSIYNRGGSLIRSFRKDDTLGGSVEWDGRGLDGNLVAPGVYYYVVKNSSKVKKGKFIIIH